MPDRNDHHDGAGPVAPVGSGGRRRAGVVERWEAPDLAGLALERADFVERLGGALDRVRAGEVEQTAVLLIEVDRLPRIARRPDDGPGERSTAAAACIRGAVRPSDLVIGILGAGVAVLCERLADRDEGHALAARIIASGAVPVNGYGPVRLTVGIAFVDPGDEQLPDVTRRAALALHGGREAEHVVVEVQEERAAVASETVEFVAVAAHELRTPLTVVMGIARTLRDRREAIATVDVDDMLDAVIRQGTRMNVLIENLLDLSRLSARPAAPATPLALADVVADALELAPPPPSTTVDVVDHAPGVRVLGSRLDLGRVIVNLLSNAYRYGGPNVTIELRRDGVHAVVAVADDGRGVPADLVGGLFEPFTRGDNGRDSPGTGLGLAISRKIVRSWGGDLTYVESSLGRCAFDVRLPATAE